MTATEGGTKRPPSLSVVMPALDEAEGIGSAVDAARTTLATLRADDVIGTFEVIVVDDGSTDATADIVRAIEAPEVRLLQHGANRGVGAALRSAIDVATGELLLSTDADMPVDLDELRRAVPLLDPGHCDLVVGRRTSFDDEPRSRVVASRAYDRFVGLLFRTDLADVNFPFKLLRTDVARSVALRTDGALVDVELLVRVRGGGGVVRSIPMGYQARQTGESKTMRPTLLGRLALELVREFRSLRSAGDRAR